jgi:hypothetical protein
MWDCGDNIAYLNGPKMGIMVVAQPGSEQGDTCLALAADDSSKFALKIDLRLLGGHRRYLDWLCTQATSLLPPLNIFKHWMLGKDQRVPVDAIVSRGPKCAMMKPECTRNILAFA